MAVGNQRFGERIQKLNIVIEEQRLKSERALERAQAALEHSQAARRHYSEHVRKTQVCKPRDLPWRRTSE